jgi:hypothetical protein
MSRSFLAMVRGPDGRSLALALVLLLALSGVFGAFNSAGMAGAGAEATLLCSGDDSTDGAGAPAIPTPSDHGSCCTLGCGPSQVGTVAAIDSAPPPTPSAQGVSPPTEAARVMALDRPASAGPRGPPVLV